jgi:hypothetical protein
MKTWQIIASLMIILIVGLSLGVAISYVIVNNIKKDEPKSVATKFQEKPTQELTKMVNDTEKPNITVSKDETTLAPEKWTGEITLAPRNAKNFKRSVISKLTEDQCGIYGQVTYNANPESDNNYVSLMQIYNTNLPGIEKGIDSNTTYSKKLLNDLPNKFNSAYQEGEFDQFNTLNFTICYRELEFPNTIVLKPYQIKSSDYESVIVFAFEQQLTLLAKKNDNYVILSGELINTAVNNDCGSKYKSDLPGTTYEARKCLRDYYIQNKEFKSLVEKKSQELLTTFAL